MSDLILGQNHTDLLDLDTEQKLDLDWIFGFSAQKGYLPTVAGLTYALNEFLRFLPVSEAKPKFKNKLRQEIDEIIIELNDEDFVNLMAKATNQNISPKEATILQKRLLIFRYKLGHFAEIYSRLEDRVNPKNPDTVDIDVLVKADFNPAWFSYDVIEQHTARQFLTISTFLFGRTNFRGEKIYDKEEYSPVLDNLRKACFEITQEFKQEIPLSYNKI